MIRRLFLYILTIFAMLHLVVACTDDDSYSSSTSLRLSFSTDTLSLDTLFSTIESKTYTFWVYNNSSDGIRISQAKLELGNQTGFRINVDGTYLDNTTGSQAQDFSLRKGDSLRVFVELTPAYTGTTTPQLVEDNLAFILESGITQRVNLRAYTWDAILYDSLIISTNQTISTDQPIVIKQGLRVDPDATLTIESPTTLYFNSSAGIDVYGTLQVSGTPSSPVVMRCSRLDNMFTYLPYDRVSGEWRGIRFYPSSQANTITYADIHGCENALQCDSATYDLSSPKLILSNTTIHNCKGYGLHSVAVAIEAVNCQFTNTLNDCVAIHGGYANIIYCTLAQFYPFSSDRGVALRFQNHYGGNPIPLHGLYCLNTIITGYSDDEIMGEQQTTDSTTAFNYLFESTIIRTPQITDTLQLANHFTNTIFESSTDTIYGARHFQLVDADLQDYNFHLDSLSTAIGRANYTLGALFTTTDHDGLERTQTPDIGCYSSTALK